MRSFAKTVALALIVLAPAVAAQTPAQTPQAKKLYDEALARERLVRQDLQRAHTDDAEASVLSKVRVLVGTYEDLSRLFSSSASYSEPGSHWRRTPLMRYEIPSNA